MIRKNISLNNPTSEIIRAEIYYEFSVKDAPVIIICHGFKGFKNWAFFPILAESLASAGYVTLTFNFSRNGIGSDLNNFSELDLFEKNTYSHELLDLKCIVDALASGKIAKGLVDPERIGLLGHSRGGGITLLYARSDKRIKCLVTWSAIATVERYTEDQIKNWDQYGYIEFENKRTHQILRVGKDLLDDIRKNKDSLDISAAAKEIDIPALIIHGQIDESVPLEEAYMIFNHLGSSSKELITIENGTHTFGASHPMESMPEQLQTVFDLSENWFDRFLK